MSADFEFIPIAVETMGAWASESLKFIVQLGRRLSAQSGENRATSYIQQNISMAVQRNNAVSIVGTIPPSKSLNELFYVL